MDKDKALRERSGEVNDDSKLVSFLYELMRGHVTPGVVEEAMGQVEPYTEVRYSNGYLANYAQDLAHRLSPTASEEENKLKDDLVHILNKRREVLSRGMGRNPEVDYQCCQAILQLLGRVI